MIPYLFVFGILSIFAILDQIRQFTKVRFLLFGVSVLLLVLFAGLRKLGVGADDFNYVEKFLEVPDVSYWVKGEFKYAFSEIHMEFGYIAFGSFIRLFTENYTLFFTSIAFLSVGIASYNYYRHSRFIFLVLILFFVHTYLYRDINQMRSAIAAAICLLLIDQLHHKQRIKALVTIGCAGLFHVASLLFLLPYALSFFHITKVHLIFGYFGAIALYIIDISSLPIVILSNLGYITKKIVGYSNSFHGDSLSLFNITNIKNSVIFFVLIFYWNFLKRRVRFFEIMMLFYFFCVTWRIAFTDFGIFAARVATFFGIVEVLLVPSIVYVFRQKIIATFLVLAYAFCTLYLNLFIKKGHNPYEFLF